MGKRIFDRAPEDRLRGFFKTILFSFNPEKYHMLSERSFIIGLRYLIFLTTLSTIILGCLLAFNMFSLRHALPTEIEKVNDIQLRGNFTDPIIVDKHKLVFANEYNYTNENLVVTDTEIIRKPTLCALLRPICILKNDPMITEYANLREHKKELSNFIFVLLLLLFPGILIVYFIYIFLKTALILAIISIIAYLIIKLIKFQIKFRRVMLSAVYASTPMVLAEPFNVMIHSLYYIHVIFFILLFSVVLLLLCERKHRYRKI